MLDIKGCKGKGKKPKMGQKFHAEHGWLFLIHILDYGILIVRCALIVRKHLILVNTAERDSPLTLLSKHFCVDKAESFHFTGHGLKKKFAPSLASSSECEAGTACCAVLLT